MTPAWLAAAARATRLDVFGIVHDAGDSVILLGPYEPGFWAAVTTSPEWDGAPDPLDRWSKRVIGDLAISWNGHAVFPSDGPPYPPFIAWATASGRAWPSPVGMLVHDRAGLLVSYRGAVRVKGLVPLPVATASPCSTCAGQPCRRACPVDALGPDGYDVDLCKGYLAIPAGGDCMTRGCVARRACPISRSYGRLAEQSSYHMRAFYPG